MDPSFSTSRQPIYSKKHPACPVDNTLDHQVGSISDPHIGNLREVIKNAMIPLLIKVFELKLAAHQAKNPPSRLQNLQTEPLEKIREKLELLSKDLDLLHLWCESSQKQVTKALKETEEEEMEKARDIASSQKETHPGIEKSFVEAVMSQQAIFDSQHAKQPVKEEKISPTSPSKSHWLRKWLPW